MTNDVTLTKADWEDLDKSAIAGIKRSLIDVEQYNQLHTLCLKRIDELNHTIII
jgi:hypothetical protein